MKPARSCCRPRPDFSRASSSRSRKTAPHPPRPRPVARLAGKPADRPRLREPAVEAVLTASACARRSKTSARRARCPCIRRCSTGWPCEFMDSGWDVKHMVRLMVTSATYRQVSTALEGVAGPRSAQPRTRAAGRWRLDAEFVRDNALDHRRPARPTHRRPEREAVSARRLLGEPELPAARMGERARTTTSGAAASTRGGSAAIVHPACSRSTRRRARNAPPTARARTSRSRRSCC